MALYDANRRSNLLVDQGVTNCLFEQTLFLVPGDGAFVQPHNLVSAVRCLKLMLQRMPEERMEAIPSPSIIERNDKDTFGLKLLQQGCAGDPRAPHRPPRNHTAHH